MCGSLKRRDECGKFRRKELADGRGENLRCLSGDFNIMCKERRVVLAFTSDQVLK
jgi:hypothetical protein